MKLINQKAQLRHLGLFLLALTPFSNVMAAEAFATDSPWMTGDWDGKRTELSNRGYNVALGYTNEIGWNEAGGYNRDRTAVYADEILVSLGMDLEKILDWKAASVQLIITDRNGEDITSQRVIDPRSGQLTSTQEVWGRGSIWRLAELSYRQRYMDGAIDMRVGRFGLGEFGEFPCEFQNLLFCGNTGGSSTGTVWYNFPVSQWALQLKYNFNHEWALQGGIFEQNPSLQENDNGFKTSFSGDKGVILPLEVIFKPQQSFFGLAGEYRAGMFVSTADADDVFLGADGQPQPFTPGGGYKRHSTREGYWTVARQHIAHIANDPKRPIEVFTQAHFNDKDTTYIRSSINLGLTSMGTFAARPKDEIGIAVGRIEVNSRFTDRQRMVNALNDETSYDSPGFIPIQKKEYSAELFYGVQVTDWLMVRPNVQYLKHPGGVEEVDDAVVIGLKIQTKI